MPADTKTTLQALNHKENAENKSKLFERNEPRMRKCRSHQVDLKVNTDIRNKSN